MADNIKRGFQSIDGSMYVDDVPLADIAKIYGTPCYVYSAVSIREQYNALEEAVKIAFSGKKKPLLCYACKANSNIAILRILKNMGSGLEIVSQGELARGLKAGFDGDRIISTSFGKSFDEIRACLEADIMQFNVEVADELDMINNIAAKMGKKAKVAFRFNPDVAGGGHSKISTGRKEDKFGNSAEKIFELYKRAGAELEHVEPVGLSIHIGSQITQLDVFRRGFTELAGMVKALRAGGFEVSKLDVGGGFAIAYEDNQELLDLDGYAGVLKEIIAPLDVEVQMEPGRYMTGNAGVLLASVQYVKETGARSFMVLNAGMNDLVRPAMYGAYHGIKPVECKMADVQSSVVYDVVGPVCESGDSFAKGRECSGVASGDVVALMSAGAYGYSMASNYNSRTLPAEILVDGDKVAVINKPQEIEELMDREAIPPWL